MEIEIPHNFVTRDYQKSLWNFIKNGGKRAVAVWHRRAGKDKTLFNLVIKEAIINKGIYYYLFPTYAQAKKVIWDGMDKNGFKFLDHIPQELIKRKNGSELQIELVNGSIIQLIGTDKIDSIRGVGLKGVVFSEFAFHNPIVWDIIRPILAESGGWALFNSTPNGKNHFYDLYNLAKENEDWFCEQLTIEDTGVLDKEFIKSERRDGMSEEMIQQEYYCSFDVGAIGSYYNELMQQAYNQDRITQLPIPNNIGVDVYFDLGRNDATAMWFKQTEGLFYNFINYHEDNNKHIDNYFNYLDEYLLQNGLKLNFIFLPHDSKAKKVTEKESCFEIACKRYGSHKIVYIERTKSTLDDINKVRKVLPQCRFNQDTCKQGIRCLEEYKKQYDIIKKIYRDEPEHDWASHGADAFRYFAVSKKNVTKVVNDSTKIFHNKMTGKYQTSGGRPINKIL